MDSRQTRVIGGNGLQTQAFELAPGILQYVQSVLVEIDTSGSGDTTPLLTVKTQDGTPVADKAQGRVLDGGGSGRATWALRLDDEKADTSITVIPGDANVSVSPTTGQFFRIGRFTLAAQIARDGAAAALTVATGALNVTTTNIKHNVVTYANGITANIAANPSRLVVVTAGLYFVHVSQAWGNFGAADFGLCLGSVVGASPLANPEIVSRRVPNEVLYHEASRLIVAFPGTVFCQAVGQNSGAPIAMNVGTLTAYRLGPVP